MKNFIFIFIQISGFLLLQNPIFAHQPFGIADKNQDSYIEVSDAKISHAFYGIFDKKYKIDKIKKEKQKNSILNKAKSLFD